MNSSKRITKLKFTFDKGVTIPSLIFSGDMYFLGIVSC